MSITLRGKFWHYEFMLHGIKYRGSTKLTVKARAEKFEALKIAEAINMGGRSRLKRAPFLSDFAGDFLEHIEKETLAGNLDHDTRRHYKHGWQLLAPTDVAGMRIDQIGMSDASVLRFPGGAWNARAAQKTLGRILNYAAEIGILRAAPRIKRTKAYGRSGLIEASMEAELLKHMEQDCADVLVIMMDCGMRPEEVMRMRWENVLWERTTIFIPHGKTPAARRYVPLSDRMRQRLRVREQDAKSPWVLPGKSEMGHRTTVAKQFEAAREAANIAPSIVLYCARHTFATNLLAETGDLALVQKVLGHESIATTQKYLHPSTSGVAEIVNKRNRTKGLKLVKSA